MVKTIVWVGSSRRDIKAFPNDIKDVMGFALYQAQVGRKASTTKPLAGFGGASVLEIVEDFQSNTYRVIYTVKFFGLIYVLHAFQKKSKKGIATPKTDVDLIRSRLRLAERDYNARETPRGRY